MNTIAPTREPFVDIFTAADYLGVTVKTVRNWLEAGRIPAYQWGPRSAYKFKLSEIDEAATRIGVA